MLSLELAFREWDSQFVSYSWAAFAIGVTGAWVGFTAAALIAKSAVQKMSRHQKDPSDRSHPWSPGGDETGPVGCGVCRNGRVQGAFRRLIGGTFLAFLFAAALPGLRNGGGFGG